jgi:hypothetical protein
MGGAAEQKIPTTKLYVGQLTEDFLRARLSHNLHCTKKGTNALCAALSNKCCWGEKQKKKERLRVDQVCYNRQTHIAMSRSLTTTSSQKPVQTLGKSLPGL